MNDLIVKNVDLFGDMVIAAQDKDGVVWVGVKWICEGIGFSDGQRQRQTSNIGEDIVLSKGVANLPLPTNGGNQLVLCLKLDYIPLWLAKVSITPNMKENNPELVNKLVKYQLQAKDVLAKAFVPQYADSDEEKLAEAYLIATKKLKERDKKIALLEQETVKMSQTITEMQPKVNYVDLVLQSKSTVCTTQIAQDYGMTANKFNRILSDIGIQRKVGKQWILYREYLPMGYVQSSTVDITRSNGMPDTVMHTKWTQKGRLFLYEELKKNGYIPLIEKKAS